MTTETAKLEQLIADGELRLTRLLTAREKLSALPSPDTAIIRQIWAAQDAILFAQNQIADLRNQLAEAREKGQERQPL